MKKILFLMLFTASCFLNLNGQSKFNSGKVEFSFQLNNADSHNRVNSFDYYMVKGENESGGEFVFDFSNVSISLYQPQITDISIEPGIYTIFINADRGTGYYSYTFEVINGGSLGVDYDGGNTWTLFDYWEW
ncbi:hypothetical protein CLV62_101522 [Dysgonomonas alginatilytica]|uniref:Uncharacterized protein n=1 Tax=Dysgonomonas alginatilytica TaxID=1605892 RepID=A0A2V3PUE7_9BACT|nr:hypothetical protein [Dysgonomonas alginatilytica]PXV69253.1 hypothetical protein CLV62_101522 [Dysgonomonas alginatilytica]